MALKWFVDDALFETLREADEWVYSDAYNKIGNEYDGYKARDPKLVYALVFELTRRQTLTGFDFEIHCDIEGQRDPFYRVWVTKK